MISSLGKPVAYLTQEVNADKSPLANSLTALLEARVKFPRLTFGVPLRFLKIIRITEGARILATYKSSPSTEIKARARVCLRYTPCFIIPWQFLEC